MDLKLPELGEGVHEGELVKWKVKEGDSVKEDQVLAEVMTDKATVEVPSHFHGKVTKLLLKEGEVVKVGQSMLSYDGGGASKAPAPSAPAQMSAAPSQTQSQPQQKASPSALSVVGASGVGSAHVAAAPSTRKLAREMGVDLGSVNGSGPGGRVTREDVERMKSGAGALSGGVPQVAPSSARGPAPTQSPVKPRPVLPNGGEERVPFRGLRKKIAEKMRESKDHAVHFTYVEECDATELVNLRNQAKAIGAAQGVKVTYLPFLMKAMVAALRQYPILNSQFDEAKQELVYKYYYNIALSVQTDDGLTAPVIKDVANKSILQLAKEIQDVVDRARAKRLTLEDLHGGTMTLTNAGSIGGLFATPVINYPEVAILGFNKIDRKPVVKKVNGVEQIVIRDWTLFSISLDHRVVDGAIGAEFMKTFIQYIETPSLLLLESL